MPLKKISNLKTANTNSPTNLDIVLWLASLIENTGRNITGDNRFSSIPLVRELVQRGLTYVAAVRKVEKELPPELVS